MNKRGWMFCGVVLFAAALPVCAQPCPPQGLPARVSIQYEANASRSGLSLQGEATLELNRIGTDYTLTTALSTSGLQWARQVSEGTVHAEQLRPRRYTESRLRRADTSTLLDWPAKKVTFADGTEAPAHPGLQDRASALLHLSVQQRAQPQAQAIEFSVASLRRISVFRFVRRETESLDLPMGSVQAVRYEYVDAADGDRLEVWLAPQHCSAPVRIRSRDHRGQDIDQKARAVAVE